MRRVLVMTAAAALIASLAGTGSAIAAPKSTTVSDRVCVGPYNTVWLQVDWSGVKSGESYGVEFQLAGTKKTYALDGGALPGAAGSGITAMAWEGVVRQYSAMRGAVLSKNLHVVAAAADWIPIDPTSLAANGWPSGDVGSSSCP
jgi:hypothetical protein